MSEPASSLLRHCCECSICRDRGEEIAAMRSAVPELVKVLEELHQKAGAVATWLNHWDTSFSQQVKWRGPTGDGQLFFNALNKAAAALAAYREKSK